MQLQGNPPVAAGEDGRAATWSQSTSSSLTTSITGASSSPQKMVLRYLKASSATSAGSHSSAPVDLDCSAVIPEDSLDLWETHRQKVALPLSELLRQTQ